MGNQPGQSVAVVFRAGFGPAQFAAEQRHQPGQALGGQPHRRRRARQCQGAVQFQARAIHRPPGHAQGHGHVHQVGHIDAKNPRLGQHGVVENVHRLAYQAARQAQFQQRRGRIAGGIARDRSPGSRGQVARKFGIAQARQHGHQLVCVHPTQAQGRTPAHEGVCPGFLIVGDFPLCHQGRGHPRVQQLVHRIKARRRDSPVHAGQHLAKPRLCPPRALTAPPGQHPAQRPGREDHMQGRIVSSHGLGRIEQRRDPCVAPTPAGNQQAKLAVFHAQPAARLGPIHGLEAFVQHDGAGAQRLHAQGWRTRVLILGDNHAVIQSGQGAKTRAFADLGTHRPQHQGLLRAKIQRGHQLVERAVGKGVHHQQIGTQHRQRGPHPLFGHGQVLRFGNARGLDDGFAGQLEGGEIFREEPGVGLGRGEKPVLRANAGERGVAA